MSNFAGNSMASGYARWRPAVHPLVVEAARDYTKARKIGLDVGCGAGLSTIALNKIAAVCIGIEPMEAMVHSAQRGLYTVAKAEAIPVRDHSVDIISAAGSLNYVDLDQFFPEARRVLVADGVLFAYDFSPGRRFVNDDSLDRWYKEFETRYPPPKGSARPLDPDILRDIAAGFDVVHGERFEYKIELDPDFYLEYVLTETSVSHAVSKGTPLQSIRTWCAQTLKDVFDRPREVLFRGYFVILRPV